MATTDLEHGLSIELPDTLRIVATTDATPARPNRTRGRPSGPIPLEPNPVAETDPVVDALTSPDLHLVRTVQLEPTPVAQQRRAQARASTGAVVKLNLDLPAREDAVVLLEQDGVYAWKFPSEVTDAPAQAVRRGANAATAQRRVVFEIAVAAADTPTIGQRGRGDRGFIQNLFVGRVKAFVFRFAARIGVAQMMKFLERHVQTGFVVMDNFEPTNWRWVDNLSALPLPTDRPARLLLFLHGTFSSTRGSYGALAATPWGHEFLAGTSASYDAVIGYDHSTLSETPFINAADLLTRLQQSNLPYPPRIDVVTYSRGGLVFRSLVEQVVPLTAWQPQFGRAIFVAVPNNGTQLARSNNWRTLIDLYTNIAIAVTRAVALIPQAQPAAMMLREVLQGLGALVKYVVVHATDETGVPGLAAMVPGGEFITTINQVQPSQPVSQKTDYCAITSEFQARLEGDHEPKEFPRRFVQLLIDLNVDRLMGETSDLVVNTASMIAIELPGAGYIKDTLTIGQSPHIYHTNYFIQPQVINALTRWLRLVEPPVAMSTRPTSRPRPRSTRRTRRTSPTTHTAKRTAVLPDLVELGAMVSPDVPAVVDTDIYVTSATTPISAVQDRIEATLPSYVVVRQEYGNEQLHYAYRAEDVLKGLEQNDPDVSLIDVLGMHEYQASERRSVVDPLQLPSVGGSATAGRSVVFDGEHVVGVLPAAEDMATLRSGHLTMTAPPRTIPDEVIARRMLPSFSRRGQARRSVASPPTARSVPPAPTTRASPVPAPDVEVPTATCYFHAEMDAEVVIDQLTTVEVLVSREVIERGTARTSAQATGTVAVDRKITLQVIPKANVVNIDNGRIEFDPPTPANPQTFYFDVQATDVGEGEVWIVARQGQVPLVTLRLKTQIVAVKQRTFRTSAEARTPEAPLLEFPLHQLRITELVRGGGVIYRFDLESPALSLFHSYESKLIEGDRLQYVSSLYKKIEERWLSSSADIKNFTAELRAFGGELLDELFPTTLQQILWKHRKKLKSIQVISTEPFIPWELVHLKQPGKSLPAEIRFLGQMGLVRWVHNAGWPPTRLRVRPGRAHYVIPQYPVEEYRLPEAEQEAAFLEQHLGATAVEPQVDPVRALLAERGAFDLLHFACHGGAEQNNITDAHLLMEGRIEGRNYIPAPLDATIVHQWGNLTGRDRNHPLVVLNACQVGRAGYKLTGIGGFSQAFLLSGAGAFIGTMWSVGDGPARVFTETFYAELLKGMTIADATINAREAARKAGDATWLAYVVYAHPHAKLTS